MSLRFLIVTAVMAAGLAGPAAAEGVRWIDPWAPADAYPELAGGPSAQFHSRQEGIVWIDPWAGDHCDCAEGRADITGSVGLAGFNGGVGNRQTLVVIQNGFYFNRSLPAGQAVMTGARAAPVHPLGRPRF